VSLPVSINLNIATLVSDAFSHINDLIPKASRSKMMIEINVVDVFDDIATFMSVKEAVQKAGYRICIDGLDYVTFTQIDRLGLGFDLAKLRWTPQMRDDTNQERRDRLTAAITRCGANRMILCWCDDKAAIDYGQSIGVSLFQGRYLDQLINPRARVIN
jgi:EAL domain-containing protein (putative c-di-GMP-specific phosphodiesterase class I)